MAKDVILVTGANGQIGTGLLKRLYALYGERNVIATDIHQPDPEHIKGPFEPLDVIDKIKLNRMIIHYRVTQVYHLAAFLSVRAEAHPQMAWKVNMEGLLNVLDACVANGVTKLFWPSSIAVFGPTSPKSNTPQDALLEPTTVYGISKLSGERWCERYHRNHGLDVRSVRYPGILSAHELSGGGTTDYAVDMFYAASNGQCYISYLTENTALPMMYMDDALDATIQLMEAPVEDITVRSSYNLGGISFTPKQLQEAILKHVDEFEVKYDPDFRQAIADSWPDSIDDSLARTDWKWKPKYEMEELVRTILTLIKAQK